ncbi:MAG: rhomboid family intramembrane serine protease [Lentimicrobium sp.]
MQDEKRRLLTSSAFFATVLAVMWAVKAFELISGISLARLGLLPLHVKGLSGILFSPLLHADVAHIAANSAPLFLLGSALMYYYRSAGLRIFFYSWLLTGVLVWLFARGNSYHIGASGVVYALASFHFISGIIRREPRLMAFSMLVIFLYGSMVWGVFPEFFPEKNISWESHLMGFVAGVILAFAYRDTGPQVKKYEWPDDEDDDGNLNPEWKQEVSDAPGKVTTTETPDFK